MNNKLIRLLAALFVLLLAATPILGCVGPEDGGTDLPTVTSEPDALATYVPATEELTEAPADATEAPVETNEAPTDLPAEEPTEAPTDAPTAAPTEEPTAAPTECPVKEDGRYNSKDEVALYIHLFGHLPQNYITKKEANALGWTGGSLEPYAPGCSIGGDYFGNYEGLLPKQQGRKYYECDIGTKGKSSRGAKRIVFSNDGLIYYSDDHYDSFTLLYGGN